MSEKHDLLSGDDVLALEAGCPPESDVEACQRWGAALVRAVTILILSGRLEPAASAESDDYVRSALCVLALHVEREIVVRTHSEQFNEADRLDEIVLMRGCPGESDVDGRTRWAESMTALVLGILIAEENDLEWDELRRALAVFARHVLSPAGPLAKPPAEAGGVESPQ